MPTGEADGSTRRGQHAASGGQGKARAGGWLLARALFFKILRLFDYTLSL